MERTAPMIQHERLFRVAPVSAFPTPRNRQLRNRFVCLAMMLGLGAAGCATTGSGAADGGRGGAGGLSVWFVDESRNIMPDSQMVAETEVFSAARRTVRLRAGQNDAVAFQIALRSEALISPSIDINVSDLQGPAGVIAARDSVKLYHVLPHRVTAFQSWYPAHTGRSATAIDVPDVLVPWDAPRGGGPIRPSSGKSEAVWVDLLIPAGAAPGEYRGTIDVKGAENGRYTLELVVLPVAIPAAPTLAIVCRVDPRDLLQTHLGWPSESAEETRLLPEVSSHQAAIRVVQSTMQLFHEHRCTPILAASFPKYRPRDDRDVDIDWSAYDALVEGWLNGSAYSDKTPSILWNYPISANYPDAARNGGFSSPQYSRLLAGYLSACQKHFAEKGWSERAFARIVPPRNVTPELVEQTRRLLGIAKQGATGVSIAAHVAPGSLRALGWHNAPTVDLPDLMIWAPGASYLDPRAATGERGLGNRLWFAPDRPPYSPSLAPEAPAVDARAIAWQAFRYEADGVWIEDAARVGSGESGRGRSPDALVYAGSTYGLAHGPIPSVRLKRMRRGALDHDLLRVLDASGRSLLAQRTAQQLVRWAFTDACARNLLATREAGWSSDPYAYWLARNVILQEAANDFSDPAAGAAAATPADWARLMNQTGVVRAEASGARLDDSGEESKVVVHLALANRGDRPIAGTWTTPQLPPGWQRIADGAMQAAPNATRMGTLEFSPGSIAYNSSGVLELPLVFEAEGGQAASSARIAVAACPLNDSAMNIDGDLSDWPISATNTAGDFLLVRGDGPEGPRGPTRRPASPTQAFFCMDSKRFYVAIVATLARGESPIAQASNIVPVDGAIPWGQDVVEVLLSPRAMRGSGADLQVLQIKPNGVVISRRGALTDPPMNASEPWQSGAQAAAKVESGKWTIEVALPLASLDPSALTARVWGCNVTRLDSRRGEYSSWSGARGDCYAPELLGNLLLQRQ